MRVLLDENVPYDLAALLVGHQVETVAGRGWSGIQNGELLSLAGADFEAFLTMDRRLPEQQKIPQLPFGVRLIQAPSNRMGWTAGTVAGPPAEARSVRPQANELSRSAGRRRRSYY